MGHVLNGKIYWIITENKYFFLFYCYNSCLFSYKKNLFPLLWHFLFSFFFQHMNNSKSNLINHSTPKPLLSMTPAVDIIESTRELEPQKKTVIDSRTIHLAWCNHECFLTITITLWNQCFHWNNILESKCNYHFPSSLK